MPKLTHIPIEQVFPRAFSGNTGIFITQNTIHKVESYTIDPFPAPEHNRNHYDSRGDTKIEYLIMHYTVYDFPISIKTFTTNQPSNRVSAHYVITEKEDYVSGGQVIQVVHDKDRAWHAGLSTWGNDKNLNAASLGIEHVNKGFTINPNTEERTWYAFDKQQVLASGMISQDIVKEYDICPTHVLGHADIAPSRKQDPGILFPWEQLYSTYKVGAWLDKDEMNPAEIISRYDPKEPCPDEVNISLFSKMLNSYGYDSNSNTESAITAFKAHFSANQQPELYNSTLNITDMYWAWALNAKYYPDTDIELVGE